MAHAGAARAVAASATFAPVPASEVAAYHLTPTENNQHYQQNAAALKSDPYLANVPLSALAGTGYTGKNGLCYPAPFHPGVKAQGYCWNNADDIGNTGARWAPQGISLAHSASGADGTFGGSGDWQVFSWHNNDADYQDDGLARVTFVDDSGAQPRFTHVLLVVPDGTADFTADAVHADSVVWYGTHLLVGTGRWLQVFDLANLVKVNTQGPDVGISGTSSSAAYSSYALPMSGEYKTLSGTDATCVVGTGSVSPCLNGLSFDRADSALVSNEYLKGAAGGRIIRWPFDLATGLPKADADGKDTADAAWVSPVWEMQGAAIVHGDLYTAGLCPARFENGNRYNSCVHTGAPDTAPHVLTAVPDGTQNLDYDAAHDRIWGVNEMIQQDPAPLRLVFSFTPAASQVTDVRLKNAGSSKCLVPYGSHLNPGTPITQWDCNGQSAQDWYWEGSYLHNFSSRACLTVEDAGTQNNAVITEWDCNESTAQQWTLRTGDGGDEVVNVGSGKCLTIKDADPTNGAGAVQWTCDNTQPLHAWTIG